MDFLSKKSSWANWQFPIIKISLLSLGIIIGAYFADFWNQWLMVLGIIFVLSTLWVFGIWFKQMK